MRRALFTTAALIFLTGCSGGSTTTVTDPKPTIDGVVTFSGLSQKHLEQGEDHTYPQSPPVGGPHSKAWLKCAVYTEELPNVNVVHSLEHGGVWITYLPDTKPDVVSTLDQYAGLNKEYVLVSPYAGQDSPIVVTAWGAQLKLTDPADPRITTFIRAYAGSGPERGTTCASSGATLPQALQYDGGNGT